MAITRSVYYYHLQEATMASGGIKNKAYPPTPVAYYSSSVPPILFNITPRFFDKNGQSERRVQWAAGLASCGATAGRFQPHMRKISRLVACCSKSSIVGESEFQEKVLNSDLPVLVDFVADWCGPCKLIAPFIDWASQVPSPPPLLFLFEDMHSQIQIRHPTLMPLEITLEDKPIGLEALSGRLHVSKIVGVLKAGCLRLNMYTFSIIFLNGLSIFLCEIGPNCLTLESSSEIAGFNPGIGVISPTVLPTRELFEDFWVFSWNQGML